MSGLSWQPDPEGEFAELHIPSETGLTPPLVIRTSFEDIQRIYTTLRASQLGADTGGNL